MVMRSKWIQMILGIIVFCSIMDRCYGVDDSSDSGSAENKTQVITPHTNVSARHIRRFRRQYSDYSSSGSDTASTILSILPLDRLGSIVGQIMSTGLKEMMNPNVGKKLINVLETQAPLLATSLFTNLLTNLRSPGRAPTGNSTSTSNSMASVALSNAVKPLSNSSNISLLNVIRDPKKK